LCQWQRWPEREWLARRQPSRQSTVGVLPYDNDTSSVTANNIGTIWYESTGGPSYCPPATNGTPAPATLSGTLSFSDGVQVTD